MHPYAINTIVTLYHGTSLKRADKIQQSGLFLCARLLKDTHWPYHLRAPHKIGIRSYHVDHVFLTSFPEYAASYAKAAAGHDFSSPVVFKLQLPFAILIPESILENDECCVEGCLSAEYIVERVLQ